MRKQSGRQQEQATFLGSAFGNLHRVYLKGTVVYEIRFMIFSALLCLLQ
jgi:hypothetical protein